MSIPLTGGSGYIGSHTLVELLQSGHQVVVLDNLYNSLAESLKRVEQITGRSVVFYQGDIRDRALQSGSLILLILICLVLAMI